MDRSFFKKIARLDVIGTKRGRHASMVPGTLGTSAHAVKAQILVALIAYLLVQILRFGFKTSISIPETMAVIGTLLLLKEPLKRLLGQLPRVTRYPISPQLCLNLCNLYGPVLIARAIFYFEAKKGRDCCHISGLFMRNKPLALMEYARALLNRSSAS